MKFMWFHAFNRPSLDAIISVLQDGIRPPPPDIRSGASQLEVGLGLTPKVYCYINRTLEVFGDNGLAIAMTAPDNGKMSPFDTGGLCDHIEPICNWSEQKRQDFLSKYSWNTNSWEQLLNAYPGNSDKAIIDYNRSERPTFVGPYQVWLDKPAADIWGSNEDCRAWTWEGRWEKVVFDVDELVAWTCSASRFQAIFERAENAESDELAAWYAKLFEKYVVGGVSEMVVQLVEIGEQR